MRRRKITFPQHYVVKLDASGKLSGGARPVINGGLSEQFGGTDQTWAAEGLLVAAVALDYQTTLQSLADEAGLAIHGFRCTAEGTLTRVDGGPALQQVLLEVDFFVASIEHERARFLAQQAKQFCIVANALKCHVDIGVAVRAGVPAPSLESVAAVTPPGWPESDEPADKTSGEPVKDSGRGGAST